MRLSLLPRGVGLAALLVTSLPLVCACGKKGASGTTPAGDGGTSEACVHPLKDLPEAQREGTVAAATSSAMTKMQVGGKALVDCPLDAVGAAAAPRVVFAHCGSVSAVTWSTASGGPGATSYFDVSGKLSGYTEQSADNGYTCGDGRTASIAVYGTVPTCQPWTEQRYCAP